MSDKRVEEITHLVSTSNHNDWTEDVKYLLSTISELEGTIEKLEKRTICTECGSTDLICAKGWMKQKKELESTISSLEAEVELLKLGMNPTQTYWRTKSIDLESSLKIAVEFLTNFIKKYREDWAFTDKDYELAKEALQKIKEKP